MDFGKNDCWNAWYFISNSYVGANAFYVNEVKTPSPPESPNGILELSKLTLGVFIGSYVAKARNSDNKGGSRENSAK